MTIRASQHRQRHWLIAVSLAVLLQGMFPAGYMPASLTDGWPVMLCPDGMPAQFFSDAHAGHHAHHQAGGDDEQTERAADSCPVGKALAAQAVPVAGFAVVGLPVTRIVRPLSSALPPAAQSFFRYRSRAPPVPQVA